jgi:outer membrane usher protein
VMADGLFAISSPVRNSFAIFKVNERAGDYRIAVEPRSGFGSSKKRYSGYSGALGPAVITSLTPYFSRSVQVDAPDAPPGTSIGGQVFELRPGFRSGYALKIGSIANVSIVGNMRDKDGDPLAFVTGELHQNDGEGKALPLFTNATGRFFVDGVEAGKEYTAKVTLGEKQIEKPLKIPADASGMYKVGEFIFFEVNVESEEKGDDQK